MSRATYKPTRASRLLRAPIYCSAKTRAHLSAKSLKKLGKGSVGKLSTTQKVIAGTALGALGVRYLVKKLSKPKTTTTDTDYASAGASNDTFGTATDE